MLTTLAFIVVVSSLAVVGKLTPTQQFQSSPISEEARLITGQDLADFVNSRQTFHKVRHSAMSDELKSVLPDAKFLVMPEEKDRAPIDFEGDLPERFDAREQWPNCSSISTIRDQSNCGSCWAVSVVSAASDRLCIQSRGKVQVLLSDEDLIACCFFCGKGCNGGSAYKAWLYIMISGLCTGGLYKTKGVCKPYSIHPCSHHKGQIFYGPCPPPDEDWGTPRCKRFCQLGYSGDYYEERFYAKKVYHVPKDEKAIQKEIMVNGPVVAAIDFYMDLFSHKSGIYVHPWDDAIPAVHWVKIIGWGVENGTNYWLISNSFGSDWGENGYLRFLRGENHCMIENWVVAGTMDSYS